ncbi:unnamed protein product [Eruca vesicaria subsp. sativa]|uniref:Uncharacterized protein n=1 Tax=Eruca vesicaria subsp. sativa TaxID=29727 RepID=A0ABC8JE67_ERUVS|nr:unnamed protein product [Eruca vesicaria subsp. sativa]
MPQLLATIPDAANTNTFLDDPEAYAATEVILNTKDILAFEAAPDLLTSGHTFASEDFIGGDKSFRARGKQPENAPLPLEVKD